MNTYEINTIKDILEKIPDDRFEVFLAELPDGLRQVKAIQKLAVIAGESLGSNTPTTLERFVWNDDGIDGVSQVTLGVRVNGEEVHSETIKL